MGRRMAEIMPVTVLTGCLQNRRSEYQSTTVKVPARTITTVAADRSHTASRSGHPLAFVAF
jgi:hypothetical protein